MFSKIIWAFTVSIMLPFSAAHAAVPTIKEIVEKLQTSNVSPSERMDLQMKIQEPDGSVKLRSLVIKRKSAKDQSAMVKLSEPANLKGVALLTVISADKKQNQWLYLPSEKRARRIVGSNKKGRFLDSELSYEDMNIATYENFTNKLKESKTENGKQVILIESVAKNKEESSYSKMNTWLEADTYLILKSEHYDEDGKLLKTVTYDNYKKYGKVSRPQKITVQNVQKKRGTVLELKKISLKPIDDSEFSMSALEEG